MGSAPMSGRFMHALPSKWGAADASVNFLHLLRVAEALPIGERSEGLTSESSVTTDLPTATPRISYSSKGFPHQPSRRSSPIWHRRVILKLCPPRRAARPWHQNTTAECGKPNQINHSRVRFVHQGAYPPTAASGVMTLSRQPGSRSMNVPTAGLEVAATVVQSGGSASGSEQGYRHHLGFHHDHILTRAE